MSSHNLSCWFLQFSHNVIRVFDSIFMIFLPFRQQVFIKVDEQLKHLVVRPPIIIIIFFTSQCLDYPQQYMNARGDEYWHGGTILKWVTPTFLSTHHHECISILSNLDVY